VGAAGSPFRAPADLQEDSDRRGVLPEPLPADSPLWAHPGVTITPHTAALTEPRTAMVPVVENIELSGAKVVDITSLSCA